MTRPNYILASIIRESCRWGPAPLITNPFVQPRRRRGRGELLSVVLCDLRVSAVQIGLVLLLSSRRFRESGSNRRRNESRIQPLMPVGIDRTAVTDGIELRDVGSVEPPIGGRDVLAQLCLRSSADNDARDGRTAEHPVDCHLWN